jgi:High-affinity Fe2+/Pb2+ permease
MSSAFIQAAVILLREGLEAMLVIAALAGYLTKAGAGHRIQALYGGALAAVGASIIAAWLFAVLNSGEHSDVLEGIIILVAAALMLYVSGWLMVKQDPRGWQEYLAHKADTALSQDTVWAVGALASCGVPRGRRNRAVHQRAGDGRRRLERRPVRGPGRRDRGSCRAVLFHQPDCAKSFRCGRCSSSPRRSCS